MATETRLRNPRYYNDKLVNVTTSHPLPLFVEPRTVRQALSDVRWKEAMCAEYQALMQNGTWELVPRNGRVPMSCKWVFRVKRKADGIVDRFKARFVAKGFLQEPGRNYFETFSLVVKPVTIQIILTIALSLGWNLRQLDIKTLSLVAPT
ncbi:PREDICTED: uncharacterized protein LOC109185285 [Ipomoea nil]|uniref:uncharacterized protein LOC109185285 n=1 Tax=Ipomoea nil TaxID=35883 RepID=UPI0009019683|nr:PREDICTED: uncharacterized protein LOC109185285 [Ipomoea nil]